MQKEIVLFFVDAINEHKVNVIYNMMAKDHIFIDQHGNVGGKESMKKGWEDYFALFPDYHIEIRDVLEAGNTFALFGFASGTYTAQEETGAPRHWDIPAAWRVVVADGRIKEWQVYADSKIQFDIVYGQKNNP